MWLEFAFAVGSRGGLLSSNQLRQERWAFYPEVDATIVSASICPADHDSCPHVICLIYTYEVENDHFSGLCARSFSTHEDALQFLGDCGDRLAMARYRPECPQESCLFIDSS